MRPPQVVTLVHRQLSQRVVMAMMMSAGLAVYELIRCLPREQWCIINATVHVLGWDERMMADGCRRALQDLV